MTIQLIEAYYNIKVSPPLYVIDNSFRKELFIFFDTNLIGFDLRNEHLQSIHKLINEHFFQLLKGSIIH